MTKPSESVLPFLQNDISTKLQRAVECGTDESLTDLFRGLNDFAWTWLNEKPRKQVSQEMSCLFSASSALVSRQLHIVPGLISRLAEVLEVSQKGANNYGMVGLDSLPNDRLQITATGGERGCRTLYVTIATGLICSTYIPTIVQGNYSVTGCNCGSFAESDMMEHFQYRLGSSTNDIKRLKADSFAYLHVQRYQPILKVFCTERGALGFRDMMKLAVVLADPFSCSFQYIGTWDKQFMRPMAEALSARNCVRNGTVVASDHLDEFTDSAAISIAHVVTEINDLGISKVPQGIALQSAESVGEECEILHAFFSQDWSQPDPKLELVLQNAALALAVSKEDNFAKEPAKHIEAWRNRLLSDQQLNKKRCQELIAGWRS